LIAIAIDLIVDSYPSVYPTISIYDLTIDNDNG